MDIVTKSFKQFTELFTTSSFHMTQNVSIMKTGVDHWSMNYCIVNSALENKDIDFIKNKFDVSGILFSPYKIAEDISLINNIYPVAEFPFMLREEVPDFYKAPVYDDMEILSVSEYPLIFEDFIDVFCVTRGVEKEEIKNKINIDNLKNNNHFFVAYLSDIPVGVFYAISYEDSAFILSASVKEQYRNSGVLNAMAKKAKEQALKLDIYNFYALPTSEFSVRVMKDQGYKMIGSYYVWQNVK